MNINCQDIHGNTALVLAVKHEDEKMVELLLELKNIALGDAPLHAARIGNSKIMELIMDRQK